MPKVIRVRAKIEGFSDKYCLLRNIENLTDLTSFRRNHVWIPLKPVETLEIGSIIEFTANIYHYGRKQKGLHKIRKVELVNEQLD